MHWPGSNLHFLTGWAGLLTLERHAAQRPYPQPFAIDLQSHIMGIARLWEEAIRYYDSRPSLAEVGIAHESARWLVTRLPQL